MCVGYVSYGDLELHFESCHHQVVVLGNRFALSDVIERVVHHAFFFEVDEIHLIVHMLNT